MDISSISSTVKEVEAQQHVKLKVSNLPSNYLELTFKGVLGRHVDRSLKTTWCISIERAEKGCVIVTVLNKDVAQLLLGKSSSIKYYKQLVKISLLAEEPQTVCVQKKQSAKGKPLGKPHLLRESVNVNTVCATVELSAADMQTAEVISAEAKTDNELNIFDVDHEMLPPESERMGSCSIKVKGISPPFVKDILLPYLEEERRDKGIDPGVEKIIIGCGDYDEVDRSIVLTVVTDRQANEFCNKLGTIEYFNDNLSVSLVNVQESDQSTFLKISGIPLPFVEALFLPFVEDARRSAGIEPDIDVSILSYGEFNNEDRSVIFQFLTFDIVEEFCCKLKSLLYLKRHTLSVSKSEKKGFMIEPSAATVKKIQQSKLSKSTQSSQNVNESASSSFQLPVQTLSQSPAFIPNELASSSGLQSSEGIQTASSSAELIRGIRTDWTTHTELQLLKLMLVNKKFLNHSASRVQGEGYKNIFIGMKTLRFNYTDSSIRRRMKGLQALPPPCMEDIVKEFEGKLPDGSTDIDNLIEQHPDIIVMKEKTSSRAPGKNYVEFVVVLDGYEATDNSKLFPGDADKVLLNAYLSLKPKFDDDKTRSDEVYGEMLTIMHTAQFTHLRLEDLSTRMGKLASDFKLRYDSMMNSTGSGTDQQLWPHYDILSRIYEKSSLIEPQKIMGFGSSFVNFSRQVKLYTKPNPPERQERKRPSKFLGDRHEDNLLLKRQIVQQMTRQNDLMQMRLESKKD